MSQIAAPDFGFQHRRQLLIGGAVIAGAIVVYAPVLYYMFLHWGQVDDYSHGYLIVPLAIYFAYARREQLARVALEGSWLGLVPLALGATALAVGRLGVELMSMRIGFVLTVIGLVLLLFGREILRILLFPLLFLFLMVPLPNTLLNVVAFPLQLVAAGAAVEVLHWLGIPALLEGNIIHLAEARLFVAEACSGLRSVMALITLGIVFAYFFRQTLLERAVIVASTIPIAILVNTLRVTLTGVLTHYFGKDAAGGFIHDFQGLITFTVAFLMLLVEARLLATFWPRGVGLAPRRELA